MFTQRLLHRMCQTLRTEERRRTALSEGGIRLPSSLESAKTWRGLWDCLWWAPPSSRSLELQAYENRLLYSAVPAPVSPPVEAATVQLAAPAVPTESTPDSLAGAQLIVVDASVPDVEELLSRITQAAPGEFSILRLDSHRDGLEQIGERLEELGQTRAIHILSHGDEAGLKLGSNWLSTDTIGLRAPSLNAWQPLLTPDAEILFYGCDLAANASGQEFLRTLGSMTGADVAASTDPTGSVGLGGDWDLEFESGAVEASSLGEQWSLFEWEGLLATSTFQQGASGYSTTLDTSISGVTPGTSNGSSTTVVVGGADDRVGLLRFDNLFGSGVGQIPLGSTITSATLRVNVTAATAEDSSIALHRILTEWNESSTWNSLGDGLVRDDQEVVTVADALISETTTTGLQTINGLESALQAWSDGATNLGWALYGDNATNWAFTSSEGASLSLRPMLIVSYTPASVVTGNELHASGEARVNVTRTNSQSTSTNGRNSHDAVGIDANGNYVIVWTSDPGDGSGAGVYGQRFNSRGLPQGGEFRINQTTTDNQQWASVAMKSDGGFIVTWTSENQDGSGQGVYARIYTAAGVGGSEFRVNSTTTGTQQASSIGVAADGSFVIAWEGAGAGDVDGIFAQRFNATGAKQGSEFRVNTTTASDQGDASIAVGNDGQFMIAWDDVVGTNGRRFHANGSAIDNNQIVLHADATSGNADIATNGTGDYHIVWRTTGGGDGSGRAIWRMSLGSTDTTAGTLFQVPANSINDQTEPAIASNSDGDFIVTWQGSGPGDTAGVFARKFLSDGTAIGTEFQLNETVAGVQAFASVAMLDHDNFVSVWSGNGPGDTSGVFLRAYGTMENRSSLLYTTDNPVTASGNPDLASWTTGDVVSFQQPNLKFGDTTTATLGIVGRLNASNDGSVKLEGMDFIQSEVVVGSGANQITLYAGDILFSVGDTESFGPLTIQHDDIAVFRPAAPWNYSAGSIFVLFDGLESVAGGVVNNRADFDLVDRDTQVGDILLRAGDLLLGDVGNSEAVVHVLSATGVGMGVTEATATTLLTPEDINLSADLQGVHLIERDTHIGGTTLKSGQLLLSVNGASPVGGNSLAATSNDVVCLTIQQTSAYGPAITTAAITVDGSDLALDTGTESLKSLAFASVGTPPAVNDDTYHLTEDNNFRSEDLWYDANWTSRMELTFNNASRAENLDDFPVLVTLDTNRFDYSQAKTNGEDLRFVDANGNLLSHEIETWNPSGRSSIWVKVPRIDAGSTTDSIHMYYGNAAATDVQNATDVWSNGYVGVWHLNGDPAGTQAIQDSSDSNVDGTSSGMDVSNRIDGPIGGALKFDGTSEYIRVATTSSDPTAVDPSQLTIEAWANSTGDTGFAERIINRRRIVLVVPVESYGLATDADDRTKLVNSSGTPDAVSATGAIPEDRWRYVVGTLSGSTSNLYVDGILTATQTGVTSFGSSNDDITIGAGEMALNSTLSQYWRGGIDEVRLSNVTRSSDWTAAQYASMTDTLIDYGDRQTVSGVLDNDQSQTVGSLVVSRVDLSELTGMVDAVILDDGQVQFDPGDSFQSLAVGESVTKHITYTAIDMNGNTDTAIANFVIHGRNDAPVLNVGAGPLRLTNVLEDSTAPTGDTVAAILATGSGALISDVDNNALQGVAVTGTDFSHGRWQFSIDGTTWSDFSAVSDNTATLLGPTAEIRFIPVTGYSGPSGNITFRAWDQTSGTNGQTGVNVSSNGGETAFSVQTTTASLTVNPLNTPPIVSTAGLTVLEGGTVIVTPVYLNTTDAESGPSGLTYTVTSGPTGGRLALATAPATAITSFTQAQLNSNQIVYIHNGGEASSDSFSVSVSDGALSATGSLTLTVAPVNDDPVVSLNQMSLSEGQTLTLSNSQLLTLDVDTADTALIYTVSSVTSGRFERVSTPGVAVTTFSQDDVTNSRVRFVHNGGESAPTAQLSVSDGTTTVGPASMSVNFGNVNDAPTVSVNMGLTLSEGTIATIGSTKLAASDPDNTAAQRVFTVTTPPVHGRLEKSTNAGIAITTFTQAEINSGLIRYVHDGAEAAGDSFAFSLSDGASAVTGSFAITVNPVNDSPVITAAQLTISEGQSLVLTSSHTQTTDPDSSATALVYAVSSVTQGQFEIVATPGTAVTTFTQDDINNGRVRFIHNGSEAAPTASLSVSDGQATAGPVAVNVSFSNVNDAPTISTIATQTLVIGQTSLPISFSVGDVETTAGTLVVSVASSDTARIPASGIVISGSGSARAVTITPASGATAGTVQVTLTVSDGNLSSSTVFNVVLGVDPNPVANDDVYTLNEDTTLDTHAQDWWDSQWTVRHRLSLNNQNRTESLQNFPILVTLDPTTFDYAQAASGGADLRFVDRDGTVLAYDIETWNPAGTSRIWVKVPQIDAASNADYLWFYSGNPAASAGANPTGVWGTEYELVYHFTTDAVTPGVVTDATGQFDGTVVGASAGTGLIGQAYSFNGTNQYIDLPSNSPILRNDSAVSFSMWIRPSDLIGIQSVFAVGVGVTSPIDSRFSLLMEGGNLKTHIRTQDSSTAATILTTSNPMVANEWQLVSVVADLVNNTESLYLNGQHLGTVSGLFLEATTPDTNSLDGAIAAQDNGASDFFFGQIDETRLQTVVRSADWINAEYASMTGALVTMSGEYYQAGVLDNDTDPQQDSLTVTLVTGPAHAKNFTFNGFGSFTYTATDDFHGDDSFTYQVNDGNGNTETATVTLHVTSLPDAPRTPGIPPVLVNEDSANTVVALADFFSDPDGDNLTYSIDSNSNSSLASVVSLDAATGQLTLGYGANQAGTADFVVRATDTTGRSITTSLQVQVAAINDAPVITTNAGLTLAEGATQTITPSRLTASDIDSATLTYTVTTSPAHGRIERTSSPGTAITTFTQSDIDNNRIRYVHNGSETTADAFSFTVGDGAASRTGSFAISITASNDTPVVVTNTGMTVVEGSGTVIANTLLATTDAESTPAQLVYTVTTAPAHGRLERTDTPGVAINSFSQADINAGVVRYIHDGSESTADGFMFSVSDGTLGTTGAFSTTVTPLNDTPVVVTNSGLTVAEASGAAITSTLLTTIDAESTPSLLVYNVTTAPAHGRLERTDFPGTAITSFTQADINSGAVRYIHDGSETTADGFSFSVGDGAASVTGSFAISIAASNDAPVVVTNIGLTVAEGSGAVITNSHLSSTDAESTPSQLVYSVTTAPAHGRLERTDTPGAAITSFTQADINSGAVRYVHDGGETTADGFTFSLSDGSLGTTGTFSITVTPVNDAPVVVTNSGVTVNEGGTVALTAAQLLTTDSESGPGSLTYQMTSPPTQGYLAHITDRNVAVTTFRQDQISNQEIVYIHSGTELALDSFQFIATDGALTSNGTVAIAIVGINDPPIMAHNQFTISESGSIILSNANLLATDADSMPSTLVYTVMSLTGGRFEFVAAAGTAITTFSQDDINNSRVRFVHDGGEVAPVVTLRLSDGVTTLGPMTTAIAFQAVNDSPVIESNTGMTVSEGGTQTITSTQLKVADSDTSVGNRVFSVTSAPVHGRLENAAQPGVVVTSFTQADINNGSIRYVHDGGESTADSWDFTVSDGEFVVAGRFAITVLSVNDSPTLSLRPIIAQEGQTSPITTAQINAIDPDNNTLTFTVSSVTGGVFRNTLTNSAVTTFTRSEIESGAIVFVHDGQEAPPSAQIQVFDGVASSLIETLSFVYTPVNDGPTIDVNHELVINEGGDAPITNLFLSASDADSGPGLLTFTVTGSPVHGRLERVAEPGINVTEFTQQELNNGSIRYVHDGGNSTVDAFNFSVSDGVEVVTGTFAISVRSFNDAPVVTGWASVQMAEDAPARVVDLHTGFSDPDGDPLTFRVVSRSNSSLLSATINPTGQLTIHGAANAWGVSELVIEARDPQGLTVTSTLQVVVNSQNDAPVVQGESFITTTGDALSLALASLTANDSDVDGDNLTIVFTTAPVHGTLQINLDGTYTYRPLIGFSGLDTINYVVSDGTTVSGPVALAITVEVVGPSGTSNSNSGKSDSSSTDRESSDALDGDAGQTDSGDGGTTGEASTTNGDSAATSSGSRPRTGSGGSGTNSEDENQLVGPIESNDDLNEMGLAVHQRRTIDDLGQRVRNGGSALDSGRERSRAESLIDSLREQATTGAVGLLIDNSASLLQLREAFASVANQTAFDEVAESLSAESQDELQFDVPVLAGASLTVGYVVWMLRGGMLLTSLLAQMPAWQIIDPLVVLDSLDKSEGDDESLGSLVEQGQSESETL